MKNITLIACCDLNRGIGYNNKLLYKIKQDLDFFRNKTMNHIVIMGSSTFKSLNYKPLYGRRNIILSKKFKEMPDDKLTKLVNDGKIEIYSSLYEMSHILDSDEEKFVIGGELIYQQFSPYANKIYLTIVESVKKSDKKFPVFPTFLYRDTILLEGKEKKLEYKIHKYERL